MTDLWGPDGDRFSEALPFLAALLPNDGSALLAPVGPSYRAADADQREKWRRVLRRCLEVSPRFEAVISATLSPSELEMILERPVAANGHSVSASVEEKVDAEGSHCRQWRPRPTKEMDVLFSGIGQELHLDLAGLVRSLLAPGQLEDDPWELLDPLAAMLGDVAVKESLRGLSLELTVGALCAEAARLVEDFLALEKSHLRVLKTQFRVLPGAETAAANLGVAMASGISDSPQLRFLQLSSAFLTTSQLLPAIGSAVMEHPKLRALEIVSWTGNPRD